MGAEYLIASLPNTHPVAGILDISWDVLTSWILGIDICVYLTVGTKSGYSLSKVRWLIVTKTPFERLHWLYYFSLDTHGGRLGKFVGFISAFWEEVPAVWNVTKLVTNSQVYNEFWDGWSLMWMGNSKKGLEDLVGREMDMTCCAKFRLVFKGVITRF